MAAGSATVVRARCGPGAQRPQVMLVQPRAQGIASHGMALSAQFRPQTAGAVPPGMAHEGGLRRRLPRDGRGLEPRH